MEHILISQLLDELTPDIRAYLFPGLHVSPVFRKESLATPDSFLDDFDPCCFGYTQKPELQKPNSCKRASPKVGVLVSRDPDALDKRTEQILAEIRRLQDKYGVSIEDIEVILGYTVQLSPLSITHSGRMFLCDYDNVEVKMPDISKALYFLFLRHPEGLRYKEVADHTSELLQIYQRLTSRDDQEEIERSINLLTAPFGNALNVNASRIKTAFKNVVSDRIARFYYLNGSAGDKKKVPLDRDLVIWEY